MFKKILFTMSVLASMSFCLSSCCEGADDDYLPSDNVQNGTQSGEGNNKTDGDDGNTYTYRFTTCATNDQLDLYDTDVTFTLADGTTTTTRLTQQNEAVTITSAGYQDFDVFYKSMIKDGAQSRINDSQHYTFPLSAYTIIVVDKDGNVLYTYSGGTVTKTVTGAQLKNNIAYFAEDYRLTCKADEAKPVYVSYNDVEFTDNDANTLTVTEGETFVDLGLTVMWASKNHLEGGYVYNGNSYFAWGEYKPKGSSYEWSNYRFMGGNNTLTKYNAADGLTELQPADDAVFVYRYLYDGNDFVRMPNYSEVKELIEKCEWTWGVYDGQKGYKVQGANGNSIFLPAAGAMGVKSIEKYGHAEGYGSIGAYWTNELKNSTAYPYQVAHCLCFENSSAKVEITVDGANQPRYAGCSVRAVLTKNVNE